MSPTSDTSEHSWRRLGDVDPARVNKAAGEAHAVATIAGAVGRSLSEAETDFGHVSLNWTDPLELWGKPVAGPAPVRAGVSLSPLSLLVGEEGGEVVRLEVEGHTVSQVYEWLEAMLTDRLGRRLGDSFQRRPVELPGRSEEQTLVPDAEGLVELGAWFSDAAATFARIVASIPEASRIRCWPHHFDIATLIAFEPDVDPEEARSIGIGLSPGDESLAEPYVYLLPWPAPDGELSLHPLCGEGEWVTAGWFGARLSGSALVAAGGADEQALRLKSFVDSALEASRALLGVEGS